MPERLADEFLSRIADEYLAAVEAGSRTPGKAIAEAHGRPAKTVQGWIARCRDRGFLPPGEAGRISDGTRRCPTCSGAGRVADSA